MSANLTLPVRVMTIVEVDFCSRRSARVTQLGFCPWVSWGEFVALLFEISGRERWVETPCRRNWLKRFPISTFSHFQ